MLKAHESLSARVWRKRFLFKKLNINIRLKLRIEVLDFSLFSFKEKVDTLETMFFVLPIVNYYESEIISVNK